MTNIRHCRFLAVVFATIAMAATASQAQTFTIIHNFVGTDGSRPADGVVIDKSGNLLGTTQFGGNFNAGTIFKITPSGEESVLHNFGRLLTNGTDPNVAPVIDQEGNIWGVTETGGTAQTKCTSGCGVAYLLGDTGTFTILHRFTYPLAFPTSRLVRDKNQNLFGTTRGLVSNIGMVYEMDRKGHFTVLHKFPFNTDTGIAPDGGLLDGPVAFDQAGNIYGTATAGGSAGCGLTFKLDPAGTETIVHDFTGSTDGCTPLGGLTPDASGNLYGVAASGGDVSCGFDGGGGCGVIYKIATDGTFSVVYTFENGRDNFAPSSHLAIDASGNFYGATDGGPADDAGGTVFKFSPTGGVLTTLHHFDSDFGESDLILPSEVSVDSQGNVFGTTQQGGDPTCNCGVVFEITPE